MKFYRVIGDDGQPYFAAREAGEPDPARHVGQPAPIKVPRLPADFEEWDEATGAFVKDHAAAADHLAGPSAIAAAHAVKVVEAILILSGVKFDGLLTAEARALGLSVNDLAQTVINKAQPALEAEIARRIEKQRVPNTRKEI